MLLLVDAVSNPCASLDALAHTVVMQSSTGPVVLSPLGPTATATNAVLRLKYYHYTCAFSVMNVSPIELTFGIYLTDFFGSVL